MTSQTVNFGEYRPPETEDEFLRLASERWKLADRSESEARAAMLDDWKFREGEHQWPSIIRGKRKAAGEPCISMNRIDQTVKGVVNEERKQRPTVRIDPVGDGADKDLADIFEGMVRQIERNSDAEIADDWAYECAVTCGRGWEEIVARYVDDESFDQELAVERIENPFSVYDDPMAEKPGGRDRKWLFRVIDIPKYEYVQRWPNSKAASLSDFKGTGNQWPGWAGDRFIRVADYWHIETEYKTLKGKKGQERRVEIAKVYCSKINAVEVLEPEKAKKDDCWGQLWIGKSIPYIRVDGDCYSIDGNRRVAGIIREAKDPQRTYNYWYAAATTKIALGQRAPFLVAQGQVKGFEKEWETLNVVNSPYLTYKPVVVDGVAIDKPQRIEVEPAIQGMVEMLQQSDYNIQATTGRFNPSVGKPSTQAESGRAIQALQNQSDTANYNYADNLGRAVEERGEIFVELIPKVYDAPRIEHAINPDGTRTKVGIFNSKANGLSASEAFQELQGIDPEINKVYDLGIGKYDVTVDIGPSHNTKRQQAVATQLTLMNTLPNQAPFFADIAVRNMDIPQADEMAERIKAMQPPQIQALADEETAGNQIAQLTQQAGQLSQQNSALVQALQEKTQMIEQKQVEANARIEVARIQSATQLAVAEINAKLQDLKARTEANRDLTILDREINRDVYTEHHKAAHDLAMRESAPPPEMPVNGNGDQNV